MLPVIALVGRPNVGKSTLFNRLTRSRDALVADLSGLTRDRKYGDGKVGDHDYIVIDTGGISGGEEGIDHEMYRQSMTAIEEADVVLFMVDGRAGLNPSDEMIADHLRRSKKSVQIVVNKTDGIDPDTAMADFHSMGLGEPVAIAASHGRGVTQLIEYVLEPYVDLSAPADEVDAGHKNHSTDMRVAIIGRPNVGKSTLVNRILGEERVVVYDQAGTTRDSIYIPFERDGREYTLIDTAGVRRRKNVKEVVEKFSIIKTMQAIQDSNVVVFIIDARDGLTEQDMHMLGYITEAGRALVIALNKWDGMSSEDKDKVKEQIQRRLLFTSFARFHFISALHGTGVGDLYRSVEEAFDSAMAKWSTNRLTTLLQDMVADHQPPMINGRRIKLRYAHQGGSNPPIIIVHGNQTDSLPGSYKRYLENKFIQVLKIRGTPVRFEFRTGSNPFEEKSKDASKRQGAKGAKPERFKRYIEEAKTKARRQAKKAR